MVANRKVGTGLIATAVISSWTYPSGLLGFSSLPYFYGIAMGFWCSNGQSAVICAFAFLAIQTKLKAPNAHTLTELIKVRHGRTAHIVWIVLALLNNVLNFCSLLVAASTAVSSLTGMNIIASTYLLPTGVAVYTYFGGLRATFLTDYLHTFIVMIVVVWITLKIITINEIGSLSALYDIIRKLPSEGSIAGNHDGSYLTMTSKNSILFGLFHIA